MSKPIEIETDEDVKLVTPSTSELKLEQLINNGFILVQWIGHRSMMKLAVAAKGAIRSYGPKNYGLVKPGEWLMILAADFDARFYRRPTPEEKPDKSDVTLNVSGKYGHIIRVTW